MPLPRSILVRGDVVLDRHIYRGERPTLGSRSGRGLHQVEEWGGAALTHALIQATLAADVADRARRAPSKSAPGTPPGPVAEVIGPGPAALAYDPWPDRLTGWALWSPHPAIGKVGGTVWGVEQALGYGTADPPSQRCLAPADDPGVTPDILVLDDAGEAFRRADHADLWRLPPPGQAQDLPPWIVLKLAGSLGAGDLWDRLMHCDPGQRLVVLMSAKMLREAGVRLSRGLSWERTAEHLLAALAEHPTVSALARARHVIVSFESDGAVWADLSDPARPAAQILFDPAHVEGEWAQGFAGQAFGFQSCMAAAAVLTLSAHDPDTGEPDFRGAINAALSAMRDLRALGHGPTTAPDGRPASGGGFPVKRLAEILARRHERFAAAPAPWPFVAAPAPWPPRPGEVWTVLGDRYALEAGGRPLFGFARRLALYGEVMLDDVPHLRLGRLLTADRTEMEALHGLRRLLEAHKSNTAAKRPLSIGVFGPPGVGKSFGVRELATGVFAPPGAKAYDGWMEFNLSQFDGPEDLIGALHQVRDRVLQGVIPVVFWDEFDSQNLKWLRFLLAPMQDGRFQEGQVTHTLGRCVFVFAGGTAARFADFGSAGVAEAHDPFRMAKGPDFKSRLDDHLDVRGPNQDGPLDLFHPVRRALLIRALLGLGGREALDIEFGLLTALLEVDRYIHGARSMEKLLEPLRAARSADGGVVRRWRLPAPSQIEAHVDAEAFHRLCAAAAPFHAPKVVEALAPAIHEAWRPIARRQGRPPTWDMAFEALPAPVQAANRAAARRMPETLALVGLRLEPGTAEEDAERDVRALLERHLETLAEAEHRGWMAHLLSEGWTFAEKRDDDARRHDCLRPYHELSPHEKDKDRDCIRHYPDFARLAGFKVVGI